MSCPVCGFREPLAIGAKRTGSQSWEVCCPDCGYHVVDQPSKSAALYSFRHRRGTFCAEVSA